MKIKINGRDVKIMSESATKKEIAKNNAKFLASIKDIKIEVFRIGEEIQAIKRKLQEDGIVRWR